MDGQELQTTSSSVVEIVAPSVLMEMEKFVVQKGVGGKRREAGKNEIP